MTLLFTEPFDIYNTAANLTGLGGWVFRGNFGTTGSATFATGRFGGQLLLLAQGNNAAGAGYSVSLGANHSTLVVGCAIKVTSTTIGQNLLQFMDASTIQTDVRFDTSGRLLVTRNGTTLATSTISLTANIWYYLELKVTFHGSTGTYAIRLNGIVVPGIPDATGVNTIATANAFANTIGFGAGSTTTNPGNLSLDDLYVCDDQGSVNNTFLGDVELRTILPNGGGSNSGFARTGGSAGGNFTAVNENPNDADTSYVSASTVSTEDTYTYSALPTNTASVLAVVSNQVARKTASGLRHVTARYRSGGGSEADFTATDLNLSSSYVMARQIQELNPVTTVAWTSSDISTGELGTRISS